jgi:prepilin-type N-terminal cleavage/methylation domain-containing protein
MAHAAALARRLVRRTRSEHGFTLVELLTVMALLSLVMLGLTTIFISGVRTQASLAESFQSETSLHVGLDKMRKDVHLACSQTALTTSSVTLSLSPCDGSVLVTWCTRGSGSSYSLYRVSGSACTGGVSYADSITNSGGAIFSYYAQNTSGSNSLPRLHVDMTVNANPATTATGYHVVDDLVFRDGVRQ